MKVTISGVRGIFGEDLTLHDILQFARGFSKLADKRCVLARDTRESGKMISETAGAALMEQGIDVYNLGIAPTPFAFREARKYGAALMVTASHNPLEWNGLKFVINGRGIFEEELEKITQVPDGVKAIGEEFHPHSSYHNDIVNLIGNIGEHKIAIDAGGGAASGYAHEILADLGCNIVSINDKHGISTRGPDPTSDELADLCNTVMNSRCDIGFAFDLDGDRLVIVDKNGVKMGADITLLLAVAKTIEMGMKDFVFSVDTSKAVEKYAKERNCSVHRAKVGEANVVKQMLDNNVPAGGEGSSGGFILKDFNMCRDGMLASAFISSLLGSKTYEECMSMASQYYPIRGKIAVGSVLQKEVIENVANMLEKESSSIDYLDGIKATMDESSWVLLRGSNTEHTVRLSVESKSMERSKSLYYKYEKMVREVNEKARRKTGN